MLTTYLHQLAHIPWLAMTFSGLFGSWMVSRLLKGDPARDLIRDTLLKGGLIALAVWKLSPLVMQPALLLEGTNPLALLLAPGTEPGMYLGAAAGIWFVMRQRKKGRIPAEQLTDALPYGVLTALAVYALVTRNVGTQTELPWGMAIGTSELRYHPVFLYQLLFAATLGASLAWRKKRGKPVTFPSFWLAFSLFQIAVTFFQVAKPVFLGLSWQQIFFVGMAILAVLTADRSPNR